MSDELKSQPNEIASTVPPHGDTVRIKLLGGIIKRKCRTIKRFSLAFAKWVFIACIIGIVGGLVGSMFHIFVLKATEVREAFPWLLFLLPLGGAVIVFLYHITKTEEDAGTSLIISSIRTHTHVRLMMAPLIFISTCITHLFGGSAGREGAALQLGGSIGARVGEILRLDEKDEGLTIMCGMSAVFSALFGTPLTACFFAMEVISVGVIYYVGLVPCLASALIAYKVSLIFKLEPTRIDISQYVPKLHLVTVAQTAALAAVCAGVSIIFCMLMKFTHDKLKQTIPNGYIKAVVGGLAIIFLTLVVGTRAYNGAGTDTILRAALDGKSEWYDFLLKMIFTAITIGAGYKGGEIVPTLFIGATFGCFAGGLIGMTPQFAAAVGMAALFCGVVNCPTAAIFLSLEIFGYDGMLLFAVACGVSYMLSGYYGLYSGQKIMYSKTKPEYININAK